LTNSTVSVSSVFLLRLDYWVERPADVDRDFSAKIGVWPGFSVLGKDVVGVVCWDGKKLVIARSLFACWRCSTSKEDFQSEQLND